jgi:hypothetical protein
MKETLAVYCPLCGTNLTEETITEIMTHYEKEHGVSLLAAITMLLENAVENSVIVEK